MANGYIAQVTGAPGNYIVAQIMEGTLAQIPIGQTGWVNVNQTWPVIDNITQIMTIPILTVAMDGLSVNWTLAVENLPKAWANMCLTNYVISLAQSIQTQPVTLSSGVKIATDSISLSLILGAIIELQSGAIQGPIEFIAINGPQSWQLVDFQMAAVAIGEASKTIQAALTTCLAGIQAGTITSSAQIIALF